MPQPPEKLICLCNHNKMLFFPPKGYWAQQRHPALILSVAGEAEPMLGGSGSNGVTVADGRADGRTGGGEGGRRSGPPRDCVCSTAHVETSPTIGTIILAEVLERRRVEMKRRPRRGPTSLPALLAQRAFRSFLKGKIKRSDFITIKLSHH